MITVEMWVFPAWAGMNRPRAANCVISAGVPRVGGDEPFIGQNANGNAPCSPRGRG